MLLNYNIRLYTFVKFILISIFLLCICSMALFRGTPKADSKAHNYIFHSFV